MKAEDLYHAGIVVDDVESTLHWFSEVAGYRWCDQIAVEQPVRTPDGELTVPLRIVYSLTEPRLEIVQTVPNTVWVPASSGIHHLGYWSDDVDGDVGRLVAGGMQVEVTASTPGGTSLWAYCKGSTGPRIELVSRSLQPAMSEWFARSGASPEPTPPHPSQTDASAGG